MAVFVEWIRYTKPDSFGCHLVGNHRWSPSFQDGKCLGVAQDKTAIIQWADEQIGRVGLKNQAFDKLVVIVRFVDLPDTDFFKP